MPLRILILLTVLLTCSGSYQPIKLIEAAQVSQKPIQENVTSVPSINDEVLSCPEQNVSRSRQASPANALDDWNFEMVEYDLMDYLESLSARYQLNNGSTTPATIASDDVLKAKSEPSSSFSSQGDHSTRAPSSSLYPTTSELPTSLADQQIGESSWQYGIFDRFTRSRTTSTTAEPKYNQDPVRSDSKGRDFNDEECGLRTYDTMGAHGRKSGLDQQVEQDSEATKELHQRRQRPTILDDSVDRRPFESVVDFVRNRETQSYDDKVANWPNKNEKNAYDSYNKQPSDIAGGYESSASDEFNLIARRNWLQQQLGNTLQLFGYNSTVQKMMDPSDAREPIARENLVKKFGKVGKSSNINAQESNHDKQQSYSRDNDDMKLEARVIGGNDARLGDSPWSVSLQALVSRPGTGAIEYRHYCGGTIISEYYVLTAAHCLDFMVGRESRLFVVMGDLNWRMNAASQYGRRFGIEKLIIHSNYKNTAFGHDIGLIRTKERMRPIKVNGRYIVNSVCLPEKGVEHSGEAELVGWGLFSNRNEMADSLQIADVPILPRPLCVDLYRRRTGLIQWLIGIELITDKQVCAGTFGRGICQGDSGSALVVNEKYPREEIGVKKKRSLALRSADSKATIIGVVAFGGIRRCSYQSLPGVYMQTSKYMDWIVPRIRHM